MKKKSIAENIKYYRKQNDYTQEQFAELVNRTRSAVAGWESGATTPDIFTLIELAELFKISLSQVVGENQTDKYLPEIRSYNRKKLDSRFGKDRISLLHHKLDLLTEEELNNIEFAFKVLEEQRKSKK